MGAELFEETERVVPLVLRRFASEEVKRLQKSRVFQGLDVPHGEGEHVFLFPGYSESDKDLYFLEEYLRRINYVPEPSGIGLNLGQPWQLEHMRRRVREVVRRFGKASIVGHSYGGFAGAQIAQIEGGIKKVIALGAPFLNGVDTKGAELYESIFSSNDGVVLNLTSQFKGPHSRNIEVHSPNHFELLCHEETYIEIGSALAS